MAAVELHRPQQRRKRAGNNSDADVTFDAGAARLIRRETLIHANTSPILRLGAK